MALGLLYPGSDDGWAQAQVSQTSQEAMVEAFAEVSRAVAALYALESDGDMAYLCTTTAVGKTAEGSTIMLTAYHCVKKGVSYLVTFDGKQFHPARVWKIPHYELDRTKYPRAYGEPETDMALFLIEEPLDMRVMDMAANGSVPPGTRVVTVGYPLGVAKVRYEGIVSGYLDRPGDDSYNYILLQIFGAPGSSGSAVIDLVTGRVIGVLVAGKSGRAGLPVIFATPIDYRKHLLDVQQPNSE